MRVSHKRKCERQGKTKQADQSFVRDIFRLWNQAPFEIKEASIIRTAKHESESTAEPYQSETESNEEQEWRHRRQEEGWAA